MDAANGILQELKIGLGITTIGWVSVTFLSTPTDLKVLASFIQKVNLGGPGWKSIVTKAREGGISLDEADGPWKVPYGILCMIFGSMCVYGLLLGTGQFIYGNLLNGTILLAVAALLGCGITRYWKRIF